MSAQDRQKLAEAVRTAFAAHYRTGNYADLGMAMQDVQNDLLAALAQPCQECEALRAQGRGEVTAPSSQPDARPHRMENASVYCRYCGAHPDNWQREQCEHREPDARTAREHAETAVQEAKKLTDLLRRGGPGWFLFAKKIPDVCDAALDALLAQVERLEQERDEARAERSTVYKRGDDFAHHFWKERAVQAERERDEARAERSTLYQRGDDFAHDVWKERATSAEAVAQRYREALWSIASGAWMEDAPRHKYSVRVFARRALACDPLVCRDPDLCWGTGTCPRDPACNE